MHVSNLRILLFKTIMFSAALCLLISIYSPQVSASQSDAAAAISQAQKTISDCYASAKAAEAKGANITSLAKILNEAGSLLSKAELAYSQGDFDVASSYATQSHDKLSNFVAKADSLRQAAVQRENRDFLINVLGSAGGAVAVVIIGAVVWVALKRKYGSGDVNAHEASAV